MNMKILKHDIASYEVAHENAIKDTDNFRHGSA
jgi:hypothetical protein